jgi:alpha-tubulin suppressor-like RCC1 family protein
VKNQAVTFSGTLPTTVKRPVQLWAKTGTKWKKLTTSKTTAKGEYTLTASTSGLKLTVRVVAPKVKIAKKRYSKIVTKSRTIKTVAPSKAIQVSVGAAHACALTSVGGVKCWGSNENGQLGDGTTTGRRTAVDVVGLGSGVRAISAGGFSTCALTSAGGVKCWGANSEGQLGDTTLADRSTPVNVVGLSSGVAAISAGGQSTCALTTAGGVKCWGENSAGGVGDGTNIGRTTPTDVVGLARGMTAISASAGHACALTTSGGAKCWGMNRGGAIGDGTGWNRYEPVDVVGLSSPLTAIDASGDGVCGLTKQGGVMCWGDVGDDEGHTLKWAPTAIEGLSSGLAAVSMPCVLTVSGGVQCWGLNNVGQIGNGTSDYQNYHPPTNVLGLTSGVIAIQASGQQRFAITSAGAIKAWGYMDGGLGDGTTAVRPKPVSVVGFG